MKKFSHSQKGQALILIVLAMVGLIGITALAVDGGNAFADKRHAQSAADAAVLAAALAKVHDSNWTSAGLQRAADNGYPNDGVRSSVELHNPPISTDCSAVDGTNPYLGNPLYIQVIIHSNNNTFFAPVLGIDQTHNCVEAIALAQPVHATQMFGGKAVVALDPSGCQAFRVHGNSNTTVVGSGLFVNSNNECVPGAFNQSGNGVVSANGICVVGSSSYSAGKVPAISHCNPVPYPPEIIFPTPSCSTDATRSGSKKAGWVITPGNIDGDWIEKDTVTLNPGIYCIDGDATVNAGTLLTGNGVLLYFIDGRLHINGGAELHLSAMSSGDYPGLLIYLPLTNSSSVIINGNSTSTFVGTILAPASDVQINGTSSNDAYHTQIIGFTIDLIGTMETTIVYEDGENFDANIPPELEISR